MTDGQIAAGWHGDVYGEWWAISNTMRCFDCMASNGIYGQPNSENVVVQIRFLSVTELTPSRP